MVSVPGGGFFLRRPLSLFRVSGDRVGILVEERGAGSRRLTESQVGDTIQLAGPLGTSFPIVGVRHAVLVGGGIGCAPLQYLGDELTAARAEVVSAFGFRDLAAARVAGAFTAAEMVVATEDGSVGRRGTVIDILASLDLLPGTVVYACGPRGMVAAVQAWCQARELRGYASLEAHMACGSGSCHGCVVETARGQMRVCSEGPVFPLSEVML
jgi:dihydroorotate dehydrogenase electron transfer subunit